MKKIISVMFLFLAAVIVLFMLLYPSLKKSKEAKVSTFEECVAAGYPVKAYYYPRSCELPNGKSIVDPHLPEPIIR